MGSKSLAKASLKSGSWVCLSWSFATSRLVTLGQAVSHTATTSSPRSQGYLPRVTLGRGRCGAVGQFNIPAHILSWACTQINMWCRESKIVLNFNTKTIMKGEVEFEL